MKKNNGDNGWLIYFIAVVLILAGIFVEPLAAVLGILIVLASLVARLIESGARKKLAKQAEEDMKKLQGQTAREETV